MPGLTRSHVNTAPAVGGKRRRGIDARAEDHLPRYVRTQSFKELEAFWYGKLKRTKFNEDGKPDPKGLPFRDLDPQNRADRLNVLTFNTETSGPRTRDGVKLKKFISLADEGMSDEDEQRLSMQLAENARTFGSLTPVADTPTARAWQAISRAANDLPEGYRGRSFLIDLAQTGVVASYLLRRHKLTRRRAIAMFDRFLLEHGMGDIHDVLVRGPVRAVHG